TFQQNPPAPADGTPRRPMASAWSLDGDDVRQLVPVGGHHDVRGLHGAASEGRLARGKNLIGASRQGEPERGGSGTLWLEERGPRAVSPGRRAVSERAPGGGRGPRCAAARTGRAEIRPVRPPAVGLGGWRGAVQKCTSAAGGVSTNQGATGFSIALNGVVQNSETGR